MKHSDINTKKNEIERRNRPYNNGFSFPTLSGSTNQSYQTTSTIFETEISPNTISKNFYSICVDWLEFTCTSEKPIELDYQLNRNPSIQIRKIDVHNNPNFRNLFKIYIHGVEICDIFSTINNNTHRYNQVSVKVANHLLYSKTYYVPVLRVLSAFRLTFDRMSRLDIALDGMDILKIIEMLNIFSKSKTIQTNNDAITILPTSFKKKDQYFDGWTIGKSKSGISARVYNKTEEIKQSGKNYIREHWTENGLSTGDIGRFEIQLNNKRLEKYQFSLLDLNQLLEAEFIGEIFTKEVQSWIKFYRVKKMDMLNHKKEVAIKNGSEIQFIKWNKIPTKQIKIETYEHKSNSAAINARNAISFTLNEILLHPETSTTAQVEIIQKYACDYQMEIYVNTKILKLFGSEVKSPYLQILKPLLRSGDLDEKMA